MADNIIKEKSFLFALRIVKLCRYLQEQKRDYVLSKQLLRSGTAIGALVREGIYAESRADFTHKMSIALKETSESDYWLELLYESEYIDEHGYRSMKKDVDELLKLLTAIVKSSKG
jgi:four helix bundle protein